LAEKLKEPAREESLTVMKESIAIDLKRTIPSGLTVKGSLLLYGCMSPSRSAFGNFLLLQCCRAKKEIAIKRNFKVRLVWKVSLQPVRS
jgi:hypothetical protein